MSLKNGKLLLEKTILFTRIAQSLQNATLEDVRAVANRLLDRVNAFCLLSNIDKRIINIFRSFQFSLSKEINNNDFWEEDVINSLKHIVLISSDFSNLGVDVKVPTGNALPQLNAIVEDANKLISLIENVKSQDSNTSNKVYNQPTINNSETSQSKTLISEIQRKLNELFVSTGKIVPLTIDGMLGNATRRALNLFKKEYNLPTGISDQSLFKQVYVATDMHNDNKQQKLKSTQQQQAIDPNNSVFNTLNQNGPKV